MQALNSRKCSRYVPHNVYGSLDLDEDGKVSEAEWTAGRGSSRHDVFVALSKDLERDRSEKWERAKASQKVKEIVQSVAAGPDHEGWRLAAERAENEAPPPRVARAVDGGGAERVHRELCGEDQRRV